MTVAAGGLRARPKTRNVKRKGYSANRVAYDRRRRLSEKTETTKDFMAVLAKDPCCFCGSREGRVRDVDHIVPLNAGGTDTWDNMTAACLRCNRGRKDTDVLSYLSRRLPCRTS